MTVLSNGDRVHLVDRKGRQYALTLKAGDTFQFSGETLAHDELIGKPDGSLVTLSRGRRMLALRPTLSEYVLKMPRGAQVLYPKDLGVILQWADIYPGARVFEAGTGSGALTMALLRAVGDRGHVISYESREDFARTAMKNIERYLGPIHNLTLRQRNAYDGIEERSVRRDSRMVAHSGCLTVARKVQPGLAPSVRPAEAEPEAGEAGRHAEGP